MKKINKVLNQKHSGFAMTLEVMVTLFMLTVFINLTIYNLRTMNTVRYFNTVITSTAIQASRWGGANTKAYAKNVSSTPMLVSAQLDLNKNAPDFNSNIYARPNKIKTNGENITVSLAYYLPSFFSANSKIAGNNGKVVDMYDNNRRSLSVTVASVMDAGDLL